MAKGFEIGVLEKRIKAIKDAFDAGRFGEALIGALNTGNGLMQDRIFGQNKDVEGNSFGVYIGRPRKARLIKSANQLQNKRNKAIAGLRLTPYQRKRARLGRQFDHKDLELRGELRRSIQTQLEGEKSAVIEFSNIESALIARGQENQITNIRNGSKAVTKGNGIKIFNLNQDEREQVIEQGKELINEILKPK